MNSNLVQNNLIDLSSFKQDYYLKKIFYADSVKNVLLPLSAIRNNGGNPTGIKNTGKNDKKLVNGRIRTRGNCIRKALHNFSDCKELSFLTLTYAANMQDIKQANYHFNLFIKKLKYHFSKYKKNTYKDLKYLVVYEYQGRGAVHFHIIFSKYISNNVILKCWLYGLNKNIKVKKGTNKYIIKYLTKYFVKTQDKVKSKNLKDLNTKAYRFSANCTDPLVKVGVVSLDLESLELFLKLKNSDNVYYFVKNNKIFGLVVDSDIEKDNFTEYKKYIPFYKIQWNHRKNIVFEKTRKLKH